MPGHRGRPLQYWPRTSQLPLSHPDPLGLPLPSYDDQNKHRALVSLHCGTLQSPTPAWGPRPPSSVPLLVIGNLFTWNGVASHTSVPPTSPSHRGRFPWRGRCSDNDACYNLAGPWEQASADHRAGGVQGHLSGASLIPDPLAHVAACSLRKQ